MAKELLSDELWAVLEPLIPPPPPQPKGGRKQVPNRATLSGILFVLKSGIPWEFLPPGDHAADCPARRGVVGALGPPPLGGPDH